MPEMQSKKLSGPKPGPATQRYLDINEIKEDVVIMKDGTLRAVLIVASINFALKSEDEQNAIIAAYVQFLNSLEFPLQIVIQSRKLNIDNYIERLKESEKNQQNELLRIQIADYRNFVQELVTLGQIMQKSFFVVVPYNPLSDKQKGFFSRLSEAFTPAIFVKLAEERFRQRKGDLMSRVEHIIGNLNSMGLKAVPLDTQSLIELYYRVYNPESYDSQKMQDTAKMRVQEEITTI
ncbi:MAG TPA: TraC family protein [Candidatus Eisenbacteria bacterium]|jgi:type IV secretory pathway VirB4 component|nr:TraC family protein [Candidatus Eisenbacteria bacterium]